MHKALDGLLAGLGMVVVAKLPCMGAKPTAQRTLSRTHVAVGGNATDGQRSQRCPSGSFRYSASFPDNPLKGLAYALQEWRHVLLTNGLVD